MKDEDYPTYGGITRSDYPFTRWDYPSSEGGSLTREMCEKLRPTLKMLQPAFDRMVEELFGKRDKE